MRTIDWINLALSIIGMMWTVLAFAINFIINLLNKRESAKEIKEINEKFITYKSEEVQNLKKIADSIIEMPYKLIEARNRIDNNNLYLPPDKKIIQDSLDEILIHVTQENNRK